MMADLAFQFNWTLMSMGMGSKANIKSVKAERIELKSNSIPIIMISTCHQGKRCVCYYTTNTNTLTSGNLEIPRWDALTPRSCVIPVEADRSALKEDRHYMKRIVISICIILFGSVVSK